MRPSVLGVLALGAGLLPAAPATRGQPAPVGTAAPAPARVRVLRLPDTPDRYADVDLPAHFKTDAVRRLDNTPRDNPITDAGATLGRVLFYDPRLSANGTVACATCHQQKHAFSDPRGRYSKGYEGKETDRNAMPLGEARY